MRRASAPEPSTCIQGVRVQDSEIIQGGWASGRGRDSVLGFRVSGFGARVLDLGVRRSDFGSRITVLVFRCSGFGFRGFGSRASCSGCREHSGFGEREGRASVPFSGHVQGPGFRD